MKMLLTTEVNKATILEKSKINVRSSGPKLYWNPSRPDATDLLFWKVENYDANSSVQRRTHPGQRSGIRAPASRRFRVDAHVHHSCRFDGTDWSGFTGPGPHGPDTRNHICRAQRNEARHGEFPHRALGEHDLYRTGVPGHGPRRPRD